MSSHPGPVRQEGESVQRDGTRRSPERDLILSALNQIDQASSWTSRQTSSVGRGLGGASGTVSPDAPTAAESSFPSAPRQDELPTKDAFPGYEIQREIHRGWQGVVYLANQINAKRRVAIKVMHGGATLGSKGRVRFEREVQLLGQLNHPNIVKLHDSGVTADGSFFYVMDYISGKALDEILREQRRDARGAVTTTTGRSKSRSRADGIEDIETTLRFFAKVCDGVNAAHLKGVINRDIKPANVRVDLSGEPVLVDFGLAKVTAGVESDIDPSNPMTMTGQFIGSLPWASPEQAVGSGDAIDLRSDVYSLGVMLYQLLTGGKFPYTVIGNMRDVLDNIQRAEPTRPSTVRRQINDEIETIVLKSLAKDRERRYQSAGELARDVRRYLNDEPIEAKRDAGWYVIRKALNKHKFAVAFAATVGILVTGSAVGMTGLWRQAEGARAVAVVERDRAEENLDAVCDLAHTFLYDFNDSIANLRGATKARETVLAKALEYLALLAEQPGRDESSLEALADAHERVGDLYGALNTANTGTTSEAAGHYASALDIRNQLVAISPGDLHHLSKLSKTWERVGDALTKQENFQGAMAAYQTGLDAAVNAQDSATRLSILTRVADTHRRLAVELVRYADVFGQRMDLAAQIYADADNGWSNLNNPEAPRRRAVLLSKSAQGLLYRGRVAEKFHNDPVAAEALLTQGNALIEQAILQFENLRVASPADYVLARDLWVVIHYLGQSQFDAATAYEALGEDRAALEARLAALQTFDRLRALAESLAMDLSNLEAQRDLATTVNKQANTLRELGRLAEARAEFASNVSRWHALYISDPVERHLRDLGVGQFKVAEMDELLAEQASTAAERAAILRLAQAGYQTTLETFREYGRRGGPADGVIGTVQKSLTRVVLSLQDG